MKVWLDDERPAPDGWIACRWPGEVIALLQAGGVEALSLDHDLGDDARGTGYDVVVWLEEAVLLRGFVPPLRLEIHSANPAGCARMAAGLLRVQEAAARRGVRPRVARRGAARQAR